MIPYDPRFVGVLTLQAYSLETPLWALRGNTRVIYTNPDELKLTVSMSKRTFLPGETVYTDIAVRTPQGTGLRAHSVWSYSIRLSPRECGPIRTLGTMDSRPIHISTIRGMDRLPASACVIFSDWTRSSLSPTASKCWLKPCLLSSPYALSDNEQGEER